MIDIYEQHYRKRTRFVNPDLRGKHSNHPTIDPDVKDTVRKFIKTILRIESHYLRKQFSREFIEGSKCIADLYRDYVQYV